MAQPTEFTLKVIAVLNKIPKGRVATYQQVAALAGRPHASRGVSWILTSSARKHGLPWQRIIASRGQIAFPPLSRHFTLQRRLLESEGVIVDRKTGAIDLKRFQYKKKTPRPRQKNQPRMFAD